MKYKLKVYHSLKSIDREQWNLGDNKLSLSMSYDYLLMIEQEHQDQIDFHYTIITKGDNTVGLHCFQMIDFKGAYIKNFFRTEVDRGFFKGLFLKVFYRLLDRLNWNLLTSGNIYFTGDNGLHFHSSISKEDRVLLMDQSFKKVDQDTSKKVTAYMVNNVYDLGFEAIHRYLKEFEYATYPVDPDMFMLFNAEWKNVDTYKSSLSSKYRVRMKKVLKDSHAVSTKILSTDEIKQYNTELYQLYLNTAQKVDLNLGFLSKNYFVRMAEIWEGRFKLIAYYVEDKMVGFMSLITDDKDVDVNYMGLDYDYNFKHKLYNRMLIDLVELGIDLQSELMHLGRTATEMKSTVGANAKSMHIYLRGKNNLLNKGMRFFEPYFGSPSYTLRSPFKKIK